MWVNNMEHIGLDLFHFCHDDYNGLFQLSPEAKFVE
jgi:hypothetical protein